MLMSNSTIDHVTLARLVEAGVVRGATVIGQKGGWCIVVQYGMTEGSLAAKHGAVRVFRKMETLIGYLRDMGIAKFSVDATQYDPDVLRLDRRRSDSSVRLKKVHAAAKQVTEIEA
jgi:hypothetical protein